MFVVLPDHVGAAPRGAGRRARRASALALALLAVPVGAAQASITVTNQNDAGVGSLRQAVVDAVAGETIVVPPGTYTLTSGELLVAKSVTIAGSGAAGTILRAGGSFRVLHVSGAATSVAVSGVTVRDGHVVSSVARGGGIYNEGATLALSDVVVTDNWADSNGVIGGSGASIAFGGGIGSDSGTLSLLRSRVTGNRASADGAAGTPAVEGGKGRTGSIGQGGGLYLSSTTVTIADTTVTGNRASAVGGPGVGSGAGGSGSIAYAGGALIEAGTKSATVRSSTISDNVADTTGGAPGPTGTTSGFGGPVKGGGLFASAGGSSSILAFTNVTIAGNASRTSPTGPADGGGVYASSSGGAKVSFTNATITRNAAVGPPGAAGGNLQTGGTGAELRNTILSAGGAMAGKENCSGATTSLGHNLQDRAAGQCALTAAGDLNGVDPLLGPLQANGGLTATTALLGGSPAVDAAGAAGCPADDQRGLARPQGAACDIGAYEMTTPGAVVTGPASGVGTSSATLTGNASNPDLVAGSAVFEYGTTTAYGRSTPAQTVAPTASAAPLAADATGLVPGTTYHFRAIASNAAGTSYGADRTFVTALRPGPPVTTQAPPSLGPGPPVLGAITLSRSRMRAHTGRGASLSPTSTSRRGANVIFFVRGGTPKVATTFTVLSRRRGFRAGRSCVAKRPRTGAARRCVRFVRLGSFSTPSTAGNNRFHLTARVQRKALRPGRYRLSAVAQDRDRRRSRARTVDFRVIG